MAVLEELQQAAAAVVESVAPAVVRIGAGGGRGGGVVVGGGLAVVAVETGSRTALEWAPSEPVVGTPVFAVGSRGEQGARVTFGLVSAVGQAFRGPRGRRITGSLEHTAPLTRGSSGSPVVDAEGRLVGLNT